MSSLDKLPTLAEMQAKRRVAPKHATLERAVENKKTLNADSRRLGKWATTVKHRDGWKDRYDGRAVEKTSKLMPRRAEAHHIAPRSDKAVRYDVRNGITLAFSTHDRVERNELRIVGTRFFTVKGKRYIDGTYPVKFMEAS